MLSMWISATAPAAALGQSDGTEARRLRLEISDLRAEESGISQGGPVAMMVVGYALAPLVLVGPALLAVSGACVEVEDEECPDLLLPGLLLTGIGAGGATVGILGLIRAIDNGDRRRALRRQIKDRKQMLEGLSLDVGLSQRSAMLQLSGRF